jgi:hypothetical protein
MYVCIMMAGQPAQGDIHMYPCMDGDYAEVYIYLYMTILRQLPRSRPLEASTVLGLGWLHLQQAPRTPVLHRPACPVWGPVSSFHWHHYVCWFWQRGPLTRPRRVGRAPLQLPHFLGVPPPRGLRASCGVLPAFLHANFRERSPSYLPQLMLSSFVRGWLRPFPFLVVPPSVGLICL